MTLKARYRDNTIMLLLLVLAKKVRAKETYLMSVLTRLVNGVIPKKFVLIIYSIFDIPRGY